MRIINVIKTNRIDGSISDINSFAIYEEQLSNDVVNEAEKYFISQCKYDSDGNEIYSDEQLDVAIENGYMDVDETMSVHLIWSDV